jgi:Flp pilus assembly protein TadD
VDERAGTNLLACLVQVGRNEEAAAFGQDLARARPDHAGLAANTARALAALGRAEEAEAWCRRALAQAPGRCDLAVMLGNLLGQQGRLDEAEAAFQTALGTPCAADAERGLAAVAAGRE